MGLRCMDLVHECVRGCTLGWIKGCVNWMGINRAGAMKIGKGRLVIMNQ